MQTPSSSFCTRAAEYHWFELCCSPRQYESVFLKYSSFHLSFVKASVWLSMVYIRDTTFRCRLIGRHRLGCRRSNEKSHRRYDRSSHRKRTGRNSAEYGCFHPRLQHQYLATRNLALTRHFVRRMTLSSDLEDTTPITSHRYSGLQLMTLKDPR